MGSRGPRRKPLHLRVIAGTEHKVQDEDSTQVAADQVLTEAPPAPAYLPNDEARAEWATVARLLMERGQLDELKLSPLGMYCALHGKIQQAMKAGTMPAAHAFQQMRGLARELGISQSAAPPAPGGDDGKKQSRWASIKSRAQKPDAD